MENTFYTNTNIEKERRIEISTLRLVPTDSFDPSGNLTIYTDGSIRKLYKPAIGGLYEIYLSSGHLRHQNNDWLMAVQLDVLMYWVLKLGKPQVDLSKMEGSQFPFDIFWKYYNEL